CTIDRDAAARHGDGAEQVEGRGLERADFAGLDDPYGDAAELLRQQATQLGRVFLDVNVDHRPAAHSNAGDSVDLEQRALGVAFGGDGGGEIVGYHRAVGYGRSAADHAHV